MDVTQMPCAAASATFFPTFLFVFYLFRTFLHMCMFCPLIPAHQSAVPVHFYFYLHCANFFRASPLTFLFICSISLLTCHSFWPAVLVPSWFGCAISGAISLAYKVMDGNLVFEACRRTAFRIDENVSVPRPGNLFVFCLRVTHCRYGGNKTKAERCNAVAFQYFFH
ncbi:unnamed protein product [Trypanosoma congolense IL3000]|uniref:WGS project CAEQ00000000 data, annotated contig 36 n=1 Tax=Trypanosoma congolense (strain IL3000) TaxID=1068625 RepID=F9WF98_TRYCI|nr:unnamed protein product [Trypanosoma congolense IL3000]